MVNLSIPILDDTLAELDEKFVLKIVQVDSQTGTALIGSNNSITITIRDNDNDSGSTGESKPNSKKSGGGAIFWLVIVCLALTYMRRLHERYGHLTK